MPRRVIDGDCVWASDKIAECSREVPATSGVYYPWIYPLADAYGCFEITSLRVIHSKICQQLPQISLMTVSQIVKDFEDHGLMFTWTEGGKRFAYWTNSDHPGRLPAPSERSRFARLTPPVPKDKLERYMRKFSSRPTRESLTIHSRSTHDSLTIESGQGIGLGLGIGIGLGKGIGLG